MEIYKKVTKYLLDDKEKIQKKFKSKSKPNTLAVDLDAVERMFEAIPLESSERRNVMKTRGILTPLKPP